MFLPLLFTLRRVQIHTESALSLLRLNLIVIASFNILTLAGDKAPRVLRLLAFKNPKLEYYKITNY